MEIDEEKDVDEKEEHSSRMSMRRRNILQGCR